MSFSGRAGKKTDSQVTHVCVKLKRTSTYVNKSRIVTLLHVVEDRRFIEACQFCHILDFVKFGRVHLLNVILIDNHYFARFLYFDGNFIAVFLLYGCRPEAIYFVRNPDQPFGRPGSLDGGIIEPILVDDQVFQLGSAEAVEVGIRHVGSEMASSSTNKILQLLRDQKLVVVASVSLKSIYSPLRLCVLPVICYDRRSIEMSD